jgi:hypothetical protein
MTKPFQDGAKLVDIAGFKAASLPHLFGAPLKRWWSLEYFQPIARIGSEGMTEWALLPVDGIEPLTSGKEANVEALQGEAQGKQRGVCEPLSLPDDKVLKQKQAELGLRTRFVSRFTAPETGELFLYVNDGMLGSKWFALGLIDYDCFYRNNSGEAEVTVEFTAPDGQLRPPANTGPNAR